MQRTDRLATVIVPGTRDVQPSFAPVAKHYNAVVEPCPPRRGNRKGAVESSVRFASGRWWRTMGAATPEEAQRSLDVFCATTGDARERRGPNGERSTVGELADAEPLLTLRSAPFPATTEVSRVVADNASVAFCGNRYSVPPGLADTTLQVRHRLGSPTIDVVAPSGAILVTHRLAPSGSGALVRSREHKEALEAAVLSAFTTARPCDKKGQPPPEQRGARRGSPTPRAHRTRARRRPLRLWRDRGGTMSESSTYQEIRSHLAYLRLGAAAARCRENSTTPGKRSSPIASSWLACSKSR